MLTAGQQLVLIMRVAQREFVYLSVGMIDGRVRYNCHDLTAVVYLFFVVSLNELVSSKARF